MRIGSVVAILALVAGCGDDGTKGNQDLATSGGADMAQLPAPDLAGNDDAGTPKKRVIIFVWDGLRPDSISATDTPNLNALQAAGVSFADNHSTYPTFTMMNGASLATGGFPGSTGFYGNSLYAPTATGKNDNGATVDFTQPVFTEDDAILQDLDAYYQNKLLIIGSLFQAAQASGLTTAAIGKRGPAFLQDYKKGGIILDEDLAWPLTFAQELQAHNVALPKKTLNLYPSGALTLSATNGDPTAAGATALLSDGKTSDPTVGVTTRFNSANQYLMQTYLLYVLPKHNPDLSVIWFRNPDATEHDYGPGSTAYKDALHSQDALLGELLQQLANLKIDTTTDVIIMSDHGHSTVSGPATLFPLRDIAAGAVTTTATDPTNGYSVSGEVRLADLLTRAGFTAFDGSGCANAPVMSGIQSTGVPVYTPQTDVGAGPGTGPTACGGTAMNPVKYTTGNFKITGALAAKTLVVVANGGSDYIYVPDHDMTTVQNVVTFLQKREEVGAIFIDGRYGDLAGTVPLSMIRVANTAGRNPDIVLSYEWDDSAVVQGMPGIEYDGTAFNNRGMHGSFSPRDVHNVLVASGPDFKTAFADTLPSGNVDVAPTVAQIFGLSLPMADGRPLLEALAQGGAAIADYTVAAGSIPSTANATGLTFQLPTDPTGATPDTGKTAGTYAITVTTKKLTKGSSSWTYFDSAKAARQ